MNPTSGERHDAEAELAGFAQPTGPDPDHGRDELERLASDLAERLRSGRPADIRDVAAGQSDLEDRLRELAPIVEALERWKSQKETECGGGELPDAIGVDRLGDCRLVREIGRGGNAIVYEAAQGRVWHRRVAVKVFPWPRPADRPAERRRFLEEASTLARLEHPHIVPIYSFGTDGGYYHYVMRLAEGGSLDRVIDRFRPRSPGTARSVVPLPPTALHRNDWRGFASLGMQVADALAYAHGRGVIHGDVKPANVLLDAAGQALVTDFGPAERPAAAAGPLAGTYRYMAPERFEGVCDERGDVYALGATLYELVTLTPIHEGNAREALTQSILRHDPIAPRLLRPEIPASLDAVIVKATARAPTARYPSAAAFAADLRNILNGRRVDAASGESLYRRIFHRRGR
jgi:serine/threonine-protein kinase